MTATGKPRKLDESAGVLVLEDRARIPIRCRVSLEGDFLYGPSGGPSPSRGTRGWGYGQPRQRWYREQMTCSGESQGKAGA